MCADKLKQGISVLTTFTDGEQPTAAKLNSITAQLRAAAAALESAVGDIHGESWPYSTDTTITLSDATRERTSISILPSSPRRKLDIASIGRLVGPASMLNPRSIGRTEVVDNTPVGVHQFSLQYVPEDKSLVVFSDPGLTNYVTGNGSSMSAPGDYSVSGTGKVVCVTLTAGGTATYDTDPRTYGGGANNQGARFNVIPDPNQTEAGGTGLLFSAPDSQGRRTVTLPTISHQQSNIEGTSTILDGDDINEGEQIRLPRSIEGLLTAGDIIPAGFLVLKNVTTGYVYTEAEYTYNNATTYLVGNVDLTDAIAAGNSFSTITVGNDLTTAVDDLRVKGFRHSHDREFGEPFINLSNIIGFTALPGASGLFIPSEIPGNFAPQYLHRDGYRAGTDAGLNDENVMRGDLVLGDSTEGDTAGTYVNHNGNSYSIYFGNPSATAMRMQKKTSGLFDVTNDDGSIRILSSVGDIELDSDGYVDLTSGGNRWVRSQGGLEATGVLSAFASVPFSTTAIIARGGFNTPRNIGSEDGGTYGQMLMAGPYRATGLLNVSHNKWEIDQDGTGSSGFGTNSQWRTPVFQVLHYGEQNVTFTGYASDGGDPGTAEDTFFWEWSVPLPSYLTTGVGGRSSLSPGGNDILGVMILAKGPNGNTQWRGPGPDPADPISVIAGAHLGENVHWFVTDNNDSSPNKLFIRCAATGDSPPNATNAFHGTSADAGFFDNGGIGTFPSCNIDVKMTLIIAAPGVLANPEIWLP
jgi:hypothetical protein